MSHGFLPKLPDTRPTHVAWQRGSGDEEGTGGSLSGIHHHDDIELGQNAPQHEDLVPVRCEAELVIAPGALGGDSFPTQCASPDRLHI